MKATVEIDQNRETDPVEAFYENASTSWTDR